MTRRTLAHGTLRPPPGPPVPGPGGGTIASGAVAAGTRATASWSYTLTPDEWHVCQEVGARIRYGHETARAAGHGAAEVVAHGKGAVTDILGLAGQIAAARLLGLSYSVTDELAAGVHHGDLPGGLEVRTRNQAGRQLWLHRGDEEWRPFVLATGRPPGPITLQGWIWGYDAMVPGYWQHLAGTQRPAYWVPNAHLRSMETLPRCACGLPAGHWHTIAEELARLEALQKQ